MDVDDFSNTKPMSQEGKDAVSSATSKAQGGIRATQQAANSALDKASDKIGELKNEASPLLEQASDQAQKLVQQAREMFNDAFQTLRDEASEVSDKAVAYTKDEPVKAMLIAAATGAALVGLISMMARSRD